jgi:hypothetical protein
MSVSRDFANVKEGMVIYQNVNSSLVVLNCTILRTMEARCNSPWIMGIPYLKRSLGPSIHSINCSQMNQCAAVRQCSILLGPCTSCRWHSQS